MVGDPSHHEIDVLPFGPQGVVSPREILDFRALVKEGRSVKGAEAPLLPQFSWSRARWLCGAAHAPQHTAGITPPTPARSRMRDTKQPQGRPAPQHHWAIDVPAAPGERFECLLAAPTNGPQATV